MLVAFALLLAYHPAPPGTFIGGPQLGAQCRPRAPALVAVDSAPTGEEFEVTLARPLGIQSSCAHVAGSPCLPLLSGSHY